MNKKAIKTTGYVAAAAVMTFNLQSCGKYEDGPGLSLRTKKARVVGDWDVVQIGAQLFPQGGYSLEFEFEKDGDLKYTYNYSYYGQTYSYTYAGTWDFSSDKEDLDMTIDGQVQSFEIQRLTNKEMWLDDTNNGGNAVQEWKLEAQ
jgi:hypothetical protein